MELLEVQKLALALAVGLLIGFQREWTAPHVAGIRTLTLVTLLGALSGLLAEGLGGVVVVASLVGVAGVTVAGGILKRAELRESGGLTTQIAVLVAYLAGAAIGMGQLALGAIVGGSTAVLLHWKRPIHGFVERMGETDARAIIRLVLIALVILPLLPNRNVGPFGVLNPFGIWLMVVLIVGISLFGYVISRIMGPRGGAIVGGVLGGVISSTATTVSYARRTRGAPNLAPVAAIVVMIASTIVFARVIFEVALVAPGILADIAPPLIAMMALMGVIAAALVAGSKSQESAPVEAKDPSELGAAITFGALYALVLVGVAAAKEHLGDRGLYVVAALSGLTDLDAITLSTAQMVKHEGLVVETAWRMILVGALANLAFKGAAIGFLGDLRLTRRILLTFGASIAGGALILIFWP